VIGDNVNLASRLESLTKEQGTPLILSKQTMDAAGDCDGVTFRSLGATRIKGKAESVEIFGVTR